MTHSSLRPCPRCSRHARTAETACPFCGERFGESFRAWAPPRAPLGRLTRAALFALGSSGALGQVAGCGSTTSNPLYGGGPMDYEPPASDAASASADSAPDARADAAAADASVDASDAKVTAPADAEDEQPTEIPAYGAFFDGF